MTSTPLITASTPSLTITGVTKNPFSTTPLRFFAQLNDARGVPLAGEQVEFYSGLNTSNPVFLCRQFTNGDGAVSCSPPATLSGLLNSLRTVSVLYRGKAPYIAPAQAHRTLL